jgi:hypothetical protein
VIRLLRFSGKLKVVKIDGDANPTLSKTWYPSVTSELLRILVCADDKRCMCVPLIDFDFRLVLLSSLIVAIAMSATLEVFGRMNCSQSAGWSVWLGGAASGIGIGIWSMHYLACKLSACPRHVGLLVFLDSLLATIFASALTFLVVSGKGDSGRGGKEESQCSIRSETFIRNRVAFLRLMIGQITRVNSKPRSLMHARCVLARD